MTKIEWTHPPGFKGETWNPVTGCTPISEGCENCYAQRFLKRKLWSYGPEVTIHDDRLVIPSRWRKPRFCFVCSMSDIFHESVPSEFIDQVFSVMLEDTRHIFVILTKRPRRALDWIEAYRYNSHGLIPQHVWWGVTAENQKRADERIPVLLQIPAAVRFVSVEPMIGPVDLRPAHDAAYDTGVCPVVKVGWIIIGAETGPGRRPCRLEWVRNLVQQCQAAGVAVFVKKLEIDGKVTGNVADWPADLRVREYPR